MLQKGRNTKGFYGERKNTMQRKKTSISNRESTNRNKVLENGTKVNIYFGDILVPATLNDKAAKSLD